MKGCRGSDKTTNGNSAHLKIYSTELVDEIK
jgi:hypothetical protein